MSRPELTGDASLFYTSKEARKYNSSSRMIGVQREITERAVELLRLPTDKPCFVLDVGCGSGLSGRVLEEKGHVWVGCDISRDMLDVANERLEEQRERNKKKRNDDDMKDEGESDSSEDEKEGDEDDDDVDEEMEEDNDDEKGKKSSSSASKKTKRLGSVGDLMHHDMGTGLPFRSATFDACISISAIQWLCYSNAKNQVPKRRLLRFFSSLYQVLKRGARAVLQFYPETAEQAILISECAAKVGFAGGIVVDYPNSAKAKKHYLVLSFDRSYKAPAALTNEGSLLGGVRVNNEEVAGGGKRKKNGKGGGRDKIHHRKKKGVKTKEWILQKKEMQRRKKGNENVRSDTKYTGRKRRDRF